RDLTTMSRKRGLDEEEDSSDDGDESIKRTRTAVNQMPTQVDFNMATPSQNQQQQSSQQVQSSQQLQATKAYIKGSIVRVKLTNFVTYTELEFVPGPRLNVVIGPNGSGKSSIVCALALGLGGGPALLGRAKQVSEFIKHGEERAIIEIELFVPTGNVTVRRVIRKDNSSEYRVNGAKATAQELHEKIKELNIQVDNLCQFLPQDKVVGFAKMTPTELLVETEKAIGLYDLYDNHMKLIESKKELGTIKSKHTNQATILEDAKKRNESLEKEVAMFHERNRILENIENLKKKRYWVLVENANSEFESVKQEKAKADVSLDELKREIVPLEKKAGAANQAIQRLNNEYQAMSDTIRARETDMSKKNAPMTKISEQIDTLHNQLDSLQKRGEERKNEIAKLTQESQRIQLQINGLASEDSIREKIDEKNKAMKELNVQQGNLKYDLSTAKSQVETLNREMEQTKQQLNQLNNIQARKLDTIKREVPDVHNAYVNILQRNKDKFRRPVYGPMCVEINVQNQDHAKYLESQCPFWVLMAFVCQTNEDSQLFKRELENQKLRGISVLYLPRDSHFNREFSLEPLKKYGIECFLDQTFECEKPVRDALLDNVALYNVVAGTRSTIGQEEALLRDTSITSFFTPSKQYARYRSKYGDKSQSTKVSLIKESKFLSGINLQEKDDLNQRLQDIQSKITAAREKFGEIESREREFQRQQKTLHEERQVLSAQIEERKKLYSRMNNITRKIDDMSTEENTVQEAAGIKKQIMLLHKRKVEVLNDIADILIDITQYNYKRDLLLLKKSREEVKFRNENAKLEELKAKIEQMERNVENHHNLLETHLAKMEELKKDWLIPVVEFIKEINTRFTKFFSAIGCNGEVILGHDETDPDNFEKYSIDIKVRFRDEDQLKALNAHVQSGGERSVSTMLFLISLQDLTSCPFRVVDEINQGMDPKNERMIFDQIVKTANRPGLPQYFLITPKLLHDLEYSQNTTVLCVFTGPWHVNQAEWDKQFKQAIQKKLEMSQRQAQANAAAN
ncbi:hypothetical protein SAMD00019534_104810, partial [Acytostelium subglobosum LB1]|uniref:hypothetical protein n=1 Tax=Acytostelium subglobosum LB1 TaxID=1410327 RepID=UPI000644BC32